MKEMLGNYADGQIEFYTAVCTSGAGMIALADIITVGYGGVGADYTNHSTHTSGRLIARTFWAAARCTISRIGYRRTPI